MGFISCNNNLKNLKYFQDKLYYIFNKRFRYFDYEVFLILSDKLKFFIKMFKDEVLYLIEDLEQEKILFLHSTGNFIKDNQEIQKIINLYLSVCKLVSMKI
ncbi:hypothetical protein [Campylobacter subantarcticus]|uniref:Uncharacterized protein n=1 Tax=Campylobacter subantarcticus LMG 24374 TaxID=1388751 RepID=A0A0A8HBK6_9BACT|nr:hypothetical protein [Campylobacter subantarcticus]AJC91473.1 hypothetical protein CSUB8521_1664 [Campylobacter subantarcticus LMG 24374]EAJ1261457.1 hypothetical protein [Campylobacter lari]